jgi:DNA primase
MASVDDLNDLDMTSWLDWMGIDYRRTTGSHGTQLNLRECPVCGGERWKVYLNEETGLGNCFHGDCETKFNKYKFIKAVLKTESFREVMKNIDDYLEIHGWKPKTEVKVPSNPFNESKSFNMPDFIPLPYEGRNLKYLSDRGITREATAYFGLGFCKSGYFQYKKPDGNIGYRDFSMRVIIPIKDIDGQLATFQGRDITGTAKQKYLFPSGVRATGSLFYNGHNAIGAEQIVINEGVFDVIATWQAFQEEAGMRSIIPVGSFGKHLSGGDSSSQIAYLLKLKEKGLKVITMMWDGEPTAIHDACKAAQELQKYGFIVRLALLPGKDPNELPPSVVRKCFWEAETVSVPMITKLMLKYPKGK